MKNKSLWCALHIVAVLVLVVATGALAQAPTPKHFSGLLNDYTPATINGHVVGPWEIRGQWSLDLKGDSGNVNFSADVNMELSDAAIPVGTAKVDDPATRAAHTHHISMTSGTISDDASICPPFNPLGTPPASGPGFVLTGPVSITANGSAAPFESKGVSTLQICVTGGTEVQYSNVTLVLTGPATMHFGMQAIHGVVRKSN